MVQINYTWLRSCFCLQFAYNYDIYTIFIRFPIGQMTYNITGLSGSCPIVLRDVYHSWIHRAIHLAAHGLPNNGRTPSINVLFPIVPRSVCANVPLYRATYISSYTISAQAIFADGSRCEWRAFAPTLIAAALLRSTWKPAFILFPFIHFLEGATD